MAIKYTPKPLPAQQRLNFSISTFYGINKLGNANGGEFTDCRNMSSDNYPYASPREPREVIASGIANPQRVLFCGDKLSYIAGGKLNVQSGESFGEVGEVGNVTSAVDFNNQKMLFYPGDFEYSYEHGSISTVESYMVKHPYGTNDTYGPEKYYTGYALQLKADSDTLIIEAPEVTDNNGKTSNGGITVNVTADDMSWINAPESDPFLNNCKLFVTAYDADNNPATSGSVPINNKRFRGPYKFGSEIRVSATTHGEYAKYYFVYAIYYNYGGLSNSENPVCLARRNADYQSESTKFWLTKSQYPGANSRPTIAYACMDNNRVVAVEGNNFYASCLGDYANWTDFTDAEGNPKETGAYAEEMYTYGDFTGIIKYNSNVILTKADLTYICYGNKPPYRINELCKSGCINGDTIAEVDGYLYWLGRDGVYRFGGGIPQLISDKIGRGFTDGVACGNGHKYYICLNDGSYKLYVYDALRNLWHIEDERQYVSLAAKEGYVYGLTADGELVKFNSGDERVEWEFTTSDFDFGTEYTKNIAKVYCRLKLYNQAWVDVYIRSNRQEWYKFANFKADGTSVFQAKAKLKKCDYFTLRFVGCGKAEIMDIYADTTLGSQKHRSGDKLTVFRKS